MILPFTHLTKNFKRCPPLHISPGTLHDVTLYTSHQEHYMMLPFSYLTKNFR